MGLGPGCHPSSGGIPEGQRKSQRKSQRSPTLSGNMSITSASCREWSRRERDSLRRNTARRRARLKANERDPRVAGPDLYAAFSRPTVLCAAGHSARHGSAGARGRRVEGCQPGSRLQGRTALHRSPLGLANWAFRATRPGPLPVMRHRWPAYSVRPILFPPKVDHR